ncbi:hypothetical protein E2C01_089444 [Portunus trituberculatus]|uniref:Uncharacterized protein n=1 Tax=Portunus trituberculatus TaxID=210409 RepID=A0A5B7JDK1_PORTR|nr:hypothetical protein [Portunus trituberculatus]
MVCETRHAEGKSPWSSPGYTLKGHPKPSVPIKPRGATGEVQVCVCAEECVEG